MESHSEWKNTTTVIRRKKNGRRGQPGFRHRKNWAADMAQKWRVGRVGATVYCTVDMMCVEQTRWTGAEKSQKMLSQLEPKGPGVGPTEEAMLEANPGELAGKRLVPIFRC